MLAFSSTEVTSRPVKSQREFIPHSLVKIQNPAGLVLKLGITGKDPTSILPWLDSIPAEPSPDCGAAHVSYDASLDSLLCDFAGAPPRQRNLALGGQLTRQSLYLNDGVQKLDQMKLFEKDR